MIDFRCGTLQHTIWACVQCTRKVNFSFGTITGTKLHKFMSEFMIENDQQVMFHDKRRHDLQVPVCL